MKNNNTVVVALTALVVGIALGYILHAQGENKWGQGMRWSQTGPETVPPGMHRMADGSLMDNSGQHMMGALGHGSHMMDMTVESERAFLEGMIPHHQEAVDTAKEVIARGGTTPEIRKLVENIALSQEQEIADMKGWYELWYGVPFSENGQYRPMMRPLASFSGRDLDRVFLEDMIMHHMGAIMMAQSVQPYIEHDEISNLTQAIVATQSAEIVQMRQLLRALD